MNSFYRIAVISFLFFNSVGSAQELNLPFHKARLSKEITAQVEGILSNGNYKHSKDTVRKTIEIKVDSLLTYLHRWLKRAVQCDSANEKECDEYWAKEEVEANERAKKSKADFLIAEQNLWLVMLSKPSKSMTPYNAWMKYHLKYEYHLETDIPVVSEESGFALILMEAMYDLYGNRFGREFGAKALFAKYYNRCSYLLQTRTKTLDEYKVKIHLVDSLIQHALKPDSTLPFFRGYAGNVYHALAQNFIILDFAGPDEPRGEEAFKLVEQLFLKSLFYQEDVRVYYNLASHYYNHAVYMQNGIQVNDMPRKEVQRKTERLVQLILESQVIFKKACTMDDRYCKYVLDK